MTWSYQAWQQPVILQHVHRTLEIDEIQTMEVTGHWTI